MDEDLTHLESNSWFGQFSESARGLVFPGRLSNSLIDGLRLHWVAEVPQKNLRGIRRLEAILEKGRRCTLHGTSERGILDPSGWRAGLDYGKGFAQAAVFWATSSDLERLSGFNITITNFAEFCFPQGFKMDAPAAGYEASPFIVDDREFSVWRGGTYSHLDQGDLGSNLNAIERVTGRDLPIRVSRADGGDEASYWLQMRRDVSWAINVNYMSPQSIDRLLADAFEVLSFSDYLLQRPCAPIRINAEIHDGDQRKHCPVLITRLMHPAALAAAKQDAHAHHLPIRLGDLDFKAVLSEWTKQGSGPLFRYIAGGISGHSGLVSENDDYARLVLVCALLEDTGADLGAGKDDRFYRTIQEWAYVTTQEKLLNISGVSDLQAFGALLSDLRNEIAHPKKERRAILAKEREIYEICEIVEAVLFSYSLSLLGVGRDTAIDAQLKLIF